MNTRFETTENLPAYIKNANRYHQLSKEEELELAKKICSDPNDTVSINKLVVANLKFVIKMANAFIGQGVSIDDLVNEGNLGLLAAARTFKPEKNTKFITFAQWQIRKHLNMAIVKYSKIVRLPVNQEYDIYKAKKAGVEVNTHTVYLDRPINDGSETTVGDMVLRTDPVHEKVELDHRNYMISVMLEVLNDEERKIVVSKYGLDGEDALDNSEIGTLMNIKPAKVSQLLREARRKMKTIGSTVE